MGAAMDDIFVKEPDESQERNAEYRLISLMGASRYEAAEIGRETACNFVRSELTLVTKQNPSGGGFSQARLHRTKLCLISSYLSLTQSNTDAAL